MLIRFWGARGSIPVSGREYDQFGGDTTCVEIRSKNGEIIVIDAGSGIRRLGNKLVAEKSKKINIIFTHSHWDHILGFPFFKPIYRKDVSIKMFGCPFAQESIKKMISATMTAPYFPVKFDDVKADIAYQPACKPGECFHIDTIEISAIILSHPNLGMGYKFTEDGKSFVFLTDNELTFKHPQGLDFEDYVEFSRGADLLVHDSEYTEEEYRVTRAWGHSVYKDALDLALQAGAKEFGLFHHNQDRTDVALQKIVDDCQKTARDRGSNLICFAVSQSLEARL